MNTHMAIQSSLLLVVCMQNNAHTEHLGMGADRICAIDSRLDRIEAEKKTTQNVMVIFLSQHTRNVQNNTESVHTQQQQLK